MIYDGTIHIRFLRLTFDITLVKNYMVLLFKKVVNRNITPPEQKQVENALTYFETKSVYVREYKINA